LIYNEIETLGIRYFNIASNNVNNSMISIVLRLLTLGESQLIDIIVRREFLMTLGYSVRGNCLKKRTMLPGNGISVKKFVRTKVEKDFQFV